jgi:hypothetical protein
MNGMKLVVPALATLAVFQGALAQTAPPPPPAELAQLKVFEGTWTCHGNVPEGPLGPARKTNTHVNAHKDLGGMWYSGRVEESASKANPHAFAGMFHMGYDTAAKSFVMVWVDNVGGWANQTASGWDGDRLVFSGPGSMMGQKIAARDTFTKKGADLAHLGELQMNDKWVVVQDETCKHAAAKK